MSIDPDYLPSQSNMNALCHMPPDKLLIWQLVALHIAITTLLFAMCAVFNLIEALPIIITGLATYNAERMADWIWSTGLYSNISALAIVALAVFAKTYLRSHFGAPAHVSELQANLSRQHVMDVCTAYMRRYCGDDEFAIDSKHGRLIAHVGSDQHSSNYLEVLTVAMDEDNTWIVIRSVTTPTGRAALLSSFFSDFGMAKTLVQEMARVFTPHASSQRCRVQGMRSSQQALPAIKPVDVEPPPSSRKVYGAYRGRSKRTACI